MVLDGRLAYRILRSPIEERVLDSDSPGIVEPEVAHEVEPLGKVRFCIEFHRHAT